MAAEPEIGKANSVEPCSYEKPAGLD